MRKPGMDKLIAKSEDSRGAGPAVLDAWLPPKTGRRVLLVEGEKDSTSAAASDLLQQLARQNTVTLGENDDLLSALPFDSDQFDLVVCAFVSSSSKVGSETLQEIGRILKPDGELLIMDYLVPGSRLHGKKADRLRDAGEYINSWMRLRNPRHRCFLDQDSWERLLRNGQWDIKKMATQDVTMEFGAWASFYAPDDLNRLRLRAMLIQAPEKAHAFLTPLMSGDRIAFRMSEIFILATKE